MRVKIFYLTGFMASGKSTIGPILANTVGWNFYDLDKEIEARENKKISLLFEEKGEEYFRKVETEVLAQLSMNKKLIIALGGGTLINPQNRKIVKKSGKLICLKCSPETTYMRLKHKRDRPVLVPQNSDIDNGKTLAKKIENVMQERKQYDKYADHIYNTDKDSIGMTVDALARLVKKYI
ncbi:MAG: shikimate kinase [Ignavibacteria bacterium]|jgi:shikimate kinase